MAFKQGLESVVCGFTFNYQFGDMHNPPSLPPQTGKQTFETLARLITDSDQVVLKGTGVVVSLLVL